MSTNTDSVDLAEDTVSGEAALAVVEALSDALKDHPCPECEKLHHKYWCRIGQALEKVTL